MSQVQLTSHYNDNVHIIIVYCLVKQLYKHQFHLTVLLVVFVEMFLHVHMPDYLSFQYLSYNDLYYMYNICIYGYQLY